MSRRVVVAAPYPTMPGPESAASLALVRELVAAGDDVVVASPEPSAAHHHIDPAGPRGAVRLARLAKGADLLHLRLDAAALGASDDAPRLLPGRLALHGVLRRAGESELRLDRVPTSVSSTWATLVLGRSTRVVVDDEAAREALVQAGVEGGRIIVAPPVEPESTPPRARRPEGPAVPGNAPTAAELQELVRRRAVEDRAANPRASTVAVGTAALPLRHLVRMERAPVRSNKPGGAFVKKSIAKVLQWQFDNVIASVNRLHQATIEAIENLEAAQGQAGDDTKR